MKARKPKRRSIEVLTALLHCKGTLMRDRRQRRMKDARAKARVFE